MKKFLFLLALTFVCLGCQSAIEITQVDAKNPLDILPGQETRPIQFEKVVIKITRGAEIGQIKYWGGLDSQYVPLTWRGGKVSVSGEELAEVFHEECEKANYPIVGDLDALFEDPSTWKAELLVAGLIKEMQILIHYPRPYGSNAHKCKGKAYIKVNWQVYSRLKRDVVYKIITEGSSDLKSAIPTGDTEVFLNAFAIATQNLLADQSFHDLVTKTKKETITDKYENLILETITEYPDVIINHVNKNRASVVTIFAGDGHGSGFFINEDGYLLTSEHVVREAKFVTIKLVTGRELIGEIRRKNHKTDIALIKTEEGGMIPLPIRKRPVKIGEEVYVLSSPLKEDFSTTLSKGVVSGFREDEGRKFIQSDVNILPGSSGGPLMDQNGNVIGITSSYFGMPNIPSGLNFFIPINDALDALSIELVH